jgi:ArsR family transcriptional regulator
MRDKLQSTECARFLKALADPERLKIVQCLQTGPKNVSEVAALLGQELVNVSHHLGVLRHAGLVQDERHGKFIIYSLHPDVFRPREGNQAVDALDLGCCRLELGGK